MSMKLWAEMCVAAGINIRNMEPIDVYLMGGKIMRDEILRKAALVRLEGSVLPEGSSVEVLKSWPEAKRIALRERVAGVVQFQGSTR